MSYDTDSALDRIMADVEPSGTPVQGSNETTTPATSNDAASTASGESDGVTEPDSFTKLDPNSLDPALLPFYRSMQSDYTRKTQEVAEQRKAMDGLDPVQARGALEFVQALNDDPSFALRVHQELSSALEQAGYTPQQAAQMAAQQVNEATTEWDDEPQQATVDPAILQRLERTESFMQNYQQEQQRQQYERQIEAQERAIRDTHPEWEQADIETVYAFAFANGGDLQAAADQYLSEQTRLASRFLQGKQAVPNAQPAATGQAFVPGEGPKTMKDATKAGIERLMAAFD